MLPGGGRVSRVSTECVGAGQERGRPPSGRVDGEQGGVQSEHRGSPAVTACVRDEHVPQQRTAMRFGPRRCTR
eukprot:4491785-Prymnesium_polylepis.3